MNGLGQVVVVFAALAIAGCAPTPIDVHEDGKSFDFGRGELLAAVDAAAADRKSPQAIASLAGKIEELSPRFNEPVEEEAERKLVFLAIGPLEAHFADPIEEQLRVLGLTVWPIVLRVEPEEGETPKEYAARVCSGKLALECKNAVPEYWPTILSAVVWRRFKERAREAYVRCGPCKTEPSKSFDKVLERYRAYQTEIGAKAALARQRAEPTRWPRAGERARIWETNVPLLELLGDGSAEFRGQVVDAAWRRMIRERRGDSEVLGLHLIPTSDVRSLRSVLKSAKAAGYRYIDLQVRDKAFPYEPLAYRLSVKNERGAKRIKVAADDSIQILVQALDIQGNDVSRL